MSKKQFILLSIFLLLIPIIVYGVPPFFVEIKRPMEDVIIVGAVLIAFSEMLMLFGIAMISMTVNWSSDE